MNVLDLFSGIGGFSLGLERAGMRTVAFCEIDPYCRAVLRKHWPDVPIHEDIRNLDGRGIAADVVCGGFPCQPFSHAGKRRGAEDDRHLWPQMCRVIAEVRPAWIVGENVPGIIGMELDNVLSDLEALGYASRTFVIPAAAVDARHRRDRIWIVANRDGDCESALSVNAGAVCGTNLAHAAGESSDQYAIGTPAPYAMPGVGCVDVDNPSGGRHGPQKGQVRAGRHGAELASRWLLEPGVGRVAHGVPARVDRLRALGNAVVPQIPEIIGRAIMRAAA